jgi:hypothetical protein
MLPTISSHLTPQVMPAFDAAAGGMKRAEKALDSAAASIAATGPSIEAMVDVVIQPEIFAANARVVTSAKDLSENTFNMLA